MDFGELMNDQGGALDGQFDAQGGYVGDDQEA